MGTTGLRRRVTMVCATVALAAGVCGSAAAQDAAEAFFADGVVHDVRLLIHKDDWSQLQARYQDNTYYPADLVWNGLRIRNVGIRSRGSGSRDQQKPGMRVDLDRYVSDQRFLGLKSFVLDNVTQDPSLVKERLAMRLFERVGLPAPREAHARLWINNELFGVYVIVEAVDKDFVARTMTPAPAPDSETPPVPERDGVLFEYKWHYPFYFSYLGSELEKYSELFEPKTHENDPPDRLYRPLEELCRFITESADEDFLDVVGAYLDLPHWIRYVAVEAFTAEDDGMLGGWGVNNFYLYRFTDKTFSRVIPWDKDNAFAQADRGVWAGTFENVLMRRALAVPELRALFLDTLAEAARVAAQPVAEDDSRGWLEAELDRASTQIRESVYVDRVKPQSNEAFESEVERLRQFARTRSAFVDCEVSNARAGDGEPRVCSVPTPEQPAARR
jgi:hypothetical protein